MFFTVTTEKIYSNKTVKTQCSGMPNAPDGDAWQPVCRLHLMWVWFIIKEPYLIMINVETDCN